jgi:hypothetical protein
MSKINNAPNTVDEITDVNRSQIEHRASWMGLIYDEMKKDGIDAEAIIRRAIRRFGNIRGENYRKKLTEPNNCEQFRSVFPGNVSVKTFDMRPISADKDNLNADFHYCALVSAWQKLGFDDGTCSLLCDIAMDGDRGVAEAMGLKLDLAETIAQGCGACKLHFHK